MAPQPANPIPQSAGRVRPGALAATSVDPPRPAAGATHDDTDSGLGQVAHEHGDGIGYEVKRWKGLPLYQCGTCHFNTMVEQKIVDHVENAAENNERLHPKKE